ncbi:MAG: MoaD/ThiS family protein [Methanocorpusculum parvum]|nr:MoaD/ThiS family protein [Methanocorpusculum parvum]
MTTVILPDGTLAETEAGTVLEILSRLGFNPYEVLATADGELLLDDEFCDEGTELKLTSIVHGG